MKIIGLCGGSGSGKGTVSEIFRHYGIMPINTDEIYHDITSADTPCLRELVANFGNGILKNGALDRRALSKIVFSEKQDALKLLNDIAHKYVLANVRSLIEEYRKRNIPAVLVDAPLLFESGFNTECDAVLAVLADKEIRVERIIKRDSITREAAISRIESQLSDEYLKKHSDYTIVNNGDLESLNLEVSRISEKILIGENSNG